MLQSFLNLHSVCLAGLYYHTHFAARKSSENSRDLANLGIKQINHLTVTTQPRGLKQLFNCVGATEGKVMQLELSEVDGGEVCNLNLEAQSSVSSTV